MKSLLKIASLNWLLIATLSYDVQAATEESKPEEELQFARAFVDALRSKNYGSALRSISLDAWIQMGDQALQHVAADFHPGEPLSVRTLGTEGRRTNEGWLRRFYFEYQFEDGYNVAWTTVSVVDSRYEVVGFGAYQTQAPQQDMRSFDWASKSTRHYVVFALTILIPLFILATVIACALTPIPAYKWIWMTFILVDIGQLSLNWAIGNLSPQPVAIGLFGASILPHGPLSSWVLSVSFPFGAVCFWFCRGQFLRQAQRIAEQER